MFKRPSPADTDEDLEKFQEQFLASKSKPAAKLISAKMPKGGSTCDKMQQLEQKPGSSNYMTTDKDIVSLGDLPAQKPSTDVAPPLKRSRFKRSRVEAKHGQVIDDPESALDKHDSHITKVLSEIVEREFDTMPLYYPSAGVIGGFPKVLHRGDVKQQESTEKGKKGRSLFAQQFAKCSASDFGLPKFDDLPSLPTPRVRDDKALSSQVIERDHSSVMKAVDPVMAVDEIEQIHIENKARLQSMTDEEILREQKSLLQTLDPDIVSFLKSRSQRSKQQVEQSRPPDPQDQTRVARKHTARDETAKNCQSKEDTKNICPTVLDSSGDNGKDKTMVEDVMDTEDSDSNVNSTSLNEQMVKMPENMSVLKPPNKWLHMDKLEPEKLEWMKDLPPPTADDNSTGKPARFDFTGELISSSANVPTYLGLHHHGEEPERAGYTLGELFHLSRSANVQQRALALDTLAKVLRKARQGRFHGSVSSALIPAMVDGGLVFILRWALDDKTENTMAAAVNALHALVVSPNDELGLDHTLCWHRGHEVPCLCPEASKLEDPDEKPSDAELVKSDLIKGLVQMTLLPRLRYVLEVWRPTRVTVIHILDILIRICRHSVQLAYEVSRCPRLLDTIFREFLTWKLPEQWPDPLTTAYGLPCSRALKLIRVLCTASKNIASRIVTDYSLIDCLLLYIGQGQQQAGPCHVELHELILESYRTWKICAIYGLGTEHYHSCYPILVEQLRNSCQLTNDSDSRSQQLACALISFLESVMQTAAKCTYGLANQRQRHNIDIGSEMERKEAPFIPTLDWSQVTGLSEPIAICLSRQLDELRQVYVNKKYDLTLTSCCLNFFASWLERVPKMPKQDVVDIMDKLESFCKQNVIPVLRSRSLSGIIAAVRKHSVILCDEAEKKSESVNNLPDFCSLIGDKAVQCPILSEGSTVHFVLAFVRLCNALRITRSVAVDVYPILLNDAELLQYLRQVCHIKRSPLASNHFAHFENVLQLALIDLTLHDPKGFDTALYHQVALNLLTHVHEGSERDVHHLLSSVIFNPALLSDLHAATDPGLAISLGDRLQIEKPTKIVSATEEEIVVDKTRLLNDLFTNLVSIRNTYLAAFGQREKALEQSRSRCEDSFQFPERLMLGRCGELLVPVDWVFLPLIEIYNAACNISDKQAKERKYLSDSVVMVTNCMRYIYFIEEYRTECLEMIAYTVRLSRLMCVFLAGNDLFLDSGIQCYLTALLQHYCKPVVLDRMDFNKPIPGLASFYDFYVMFLDQFGAVSFGDWLFCSYLLLPLQQRHSLIFRRAVWGEFSIVLRSLRPKVGQVMVPLERFLEPEETDLELLRLYFQALLSRMVLADQTPLPYLIAVHHINRFMYNRQQKHKKMARDMLKHVISLSDDILRRHLLFYKLANKDQEYGMELYAVLPTHRQSLVDSLSQS